MDMLLSSPSRNTRPHGERGPQSERPIHVTEAAGRGTLALILQPDARLILEAVQSRMAKVSARI